MNTRWLVNPEDDRLRAGWRILLFMLLIIGLAVAAMTGTRAILGGLPKTSNIIFVLLAIVATVAVFVARRWLDKKSFVSLGFGNPRNAWKDVMFGFFLSGVMAATVFGVMWQFDLIGDVQISAPDAAAVGTLTMLLLVTVLIGYWEELFFRGYLFQNMVEGLGLRPAVIVSCLLYGAAHAANPNAGITSTVIIVLFGYLRLYGYLATGLLWLSIGMHIGWNFFQGPVFGYAASGQTDIASLLTHQPSSADWLSGGKFGPEASVITIPVVLLALLAMRFWAASRLSAACSQPRQPY